MLLVLALVEILLDLAALALEIAILLDQLTKVRAGLEVVAEVQVGRGPESKKGLAEMRQRRTDLATRMLAEARGMLRR